MLIRMTKEGKTIIKIRNMVKCQKAHAMNSGQFGTQTFLLQGGV